MTDRELLQQALDALEIAHDAALVVAEHYHATMKGYRPERHAAVDAEVKQIADVIAAIRQRLDGQGRELLDKKKRAIPGAILAAAPQKGTL